MRSGWRLRPGDLPLAALIVALAALALVVLVGPVLVVVLTSFSTSAALRFPPPGYTLRWYAELFDPARSHVIQLAALNSVVVAAWRRRSRPCWRRRRRWASPATRRTGRAGRMAGSCCRWCCPASRSGWPR